MSMNTLWIVIGRMQPVHLWHKSLIDQSLKDNSNTLVLLGGGETNEKNPYSFEQRDEMLQSMYPDKNLMIDYLYDTPTDQEWVENINYQIYRLGNFDSISFYAGDVNADSAIRAITENKECLDFEQIWIIELDRKNIPISATQVRELMSNWDTKSVQRLLPSEVYNQLYLK